MLSPLSLSSRENLWLLRETGSSCTAASPLDITAFFSSSSVQREGGREGVCEYIETERGRECVCV